MRVKYFLHLCAKQALISCTAVVQAHMALSSAVPVLPSSPSPLSLVEPCLTSKTNVSGKNVSIARRELICAAIAALARPAVASGLIYPRSVAGVELPTTAVCTAAAAFSHSVSPAFLYNHALRTYVFGALHMRHHGSRYDPEIAFTAAMLHDLGLLSAYAHDNLPFEIVSADAAETLARRAGLSDKDARRIWDAAVMHDMRWSFIERQASEVVLVASGAGSDVVGPDPDMIHPRDIAEVVRMLPRLGFKNVFKNLLTAHCLHQPGSQNGTWLDSYCRAAAAPGQTSETAVAIDKAPFPD